MLLNKFFINVFIRVIMMVISGVVLGILLQHLGNGYYYTFTGVLILIVLQVYMLVNLVNKTNVNLEKFFSSVYDHDSSIRFSDKAPNSSFRKLYDKMNYLNRIIQEVKVKNERTSHFLQRVINHVDIGLLSFDESGKIEIYNHAAKRYLNVQHPRHISVVKTTNQELYDIIQTIKPDQEILHKVLISNLLQSILIKATELRFEDNKIKLVSFQDITNELVKKELDSWQRLIRVLTHEIMNSISPITSLTSVIAGYFKNKESKSPVSSEKINDHIISQTLHGLNTIEETGKGLMEFIQKYRSLTSLPRPKADNFSVAGLFRNCKLLMESTIPVGMEITATVQPKDLMLLADYAQVEQILINLIKNAIEAVDKTRLGKIHLKAYYREGDIFIQVEDNGAGIPNHILEDIFVPFYSTKEMGSGIGLSLSKQIMQNHGGTISVSTVQNQGSVFTLKFKR